MLSMNPFLTPILCINGPAYWYFRHVLFIMHNTERFFRNEFICKVGNNPLANLIKAVQTAFSPCTFSIGKFLELGGKDVACRLTKLVRFRGFAIL
jgi:hypothetical protein